MAVMWANFLDDEAVARATALFVLNRIKKTDVLKEAYKDTLDILDAYDHQTLARPDGTYYDGNETLEEVAVNMLYDMIEKSREEDKEMIIRTVLNCMC